MIWFNTQLPAQRISQPAPAPHQLQPALTPQQVQPARKAVWVLAPAQQMRIHATCVG